MVSLFLCCAASAFGATAPFDALFDRALRRHVHEGLVDYAGMKTDTDFVAASTALAALDPDTLATGSERLAFWINAYNALVIRGVVDNYPIASVTEVGLLGRWSFFKVTEFVVGGKGHTLDQIEHGIIRPVFQDPRAHFALVCGSLGCPVLRAEVWHADRLDAELDEAARAFMNDPSRVRIETDRGVLRLSRIFKWYRDDFEKAAGSIESFLRRYRTGAEVPGGLRLEYMEYSWSLNDWKGTPAKD